MPLILADRVQQTGTANTTVSFTLSGSVTGFQTFAAANITTNDTTYYAATDASGNWEVGVGTYSTVGPTLTRTTILSSSNSGSAVTFSGTVNVFVTYPSDRSVYSDGTNIVPDSAATLLTTSGGTGLSSYTAGDLPYYATGTALSKLTIGASGRWLGSSGTAPQWNAPAALTKTDDTNVTLTLGGSASTSLLNAASLTLGWTGQLAVSRGGTGLTSGTSGGVLYYSAAGTLASSAALAANALVIGGGAGVAPSTITTGTGVVTALGVNTGTAGSFVVNGGALGTPSSGTVTNLTGTASININGTVGATTPTTGAFTTLSSTGNTTLGNATSDTVTVNGYMGVGASGAPNSGRAIAIQSTALSGPTQVGVWCNVTGTIASTSGIDSFYSLPTTANAAYTVSRVSGFYADNPNVAGSSIITNSYGLYVADQTSGTNNYGVASTVSLGTNKWNIYASGTADNYFAGKVGIGTNIPSFGLDIFSSSRPNSSISLTCTDAGALAGPYIELFRISASPANNDVLGAIYFEGANSAASLVTYAAIESVIGTVTSAAEDGALLFKTLLDGTYAERMRINSSGNLQVTGAISATTTITGGYNNPAAGTTAIAFGLDNVVKVTPNATATYTTTVPAAGTQCTLIILTSGTTSYTITFGTGFKTTGTLATGTVSARYFMISFVSDGTSVLETARTVAIA